MLKIENFISKLSHNQLKLRISLKVISDSFLYNGRVCVNNCAKIIHFQPSP